MSEAKQRARLENWRVGEYDELIGAVYGHPNFTDGEIVRTSRMVSFDPVTKKAVTRNTEYELGKPFEMLKPNDRPSYDVDL